MTTTITPADFSYPTYLASLGGGNTYITNNIATADQPIAYSPDSGAITIANADAAQAGIVSLSDQTLGAGKKTFAQMPAVAAGAYPSANTDLVTKGYVDQVSARSLSWLNAVIDFAQVSNISTPADGDRYIATDTNGDFITDHIYTYSATGSGWVGYLPIDGDTCYVSNDASIVAPNETVTYRVNASVGAWVNMGGVISYSSLVGRPNQAVGALNTTGSPTFAGLSVNGSANVSGALSSSTSISTSGLLVSNATYKATSASTGSIVCATGGIGAGKDSWFDANLSANTMHVRSSATTTSVSTGALVVDGGIGCAFVTAGGFKSTYDITAANSITVSGAYPATSTPTTGTLMVPYGGIRAGANSWFDTDISAGTLHVRSTAAATSTITGAIIDSGGLGVAGSAYVGGNLVVSGTINGSAGSGGLSSGTPRYVDNFGAQPTIPSFRASLHIATTGTLAAGGSLSQISNSGVTFSSVARRAIFADGAASGIWYDAPSAGLGSVDVLSVRAKWIPHQSATTAAACSIFALGDRASFSAQGTVYVQIFPLSATAQLSVTTSPGTNYAITGPLPTRVAAGIPMDIEANIDVSTAKMSSLWINGVCVASHVTDSGTRGATAYVSIGAGTASDTYIYGDIEDFALWSGVTQRAYNAATYLPGYTFDDTGITGSLVANGDVFARSVTVGAVTSSGDVVAQNARMTGFAQYLRAQERIAVITTSAITTTLSASSPGITLFTGTTTQTVTLPSIANASMTGAQFRIFNKSTGAVTIKSFANDTIVALSANQASTLIAYGTTETSWLNNPSSV